MKGFNHNGTINLQKKKFKGTVIIEENKELRTLNADMIKDINISIYQDNGAKCKIKLDPNFIVCYRGNYALSLEAKLKLGRVLFGPMFIKLCDFSIHDDYENALCKLFNITEIISSELELVLDIKSILIYNKKNKEVEINYVDNVDMYFAYLNQIYNLSSNNMQSKYEVICFNESEFNLIKLRRIMKTLRANTLTRKEVKDLIITSMKI